ncbi:MAG: hypothetical protein WC613_04980 [Candidatus Aenigmatarchaeota archaeon]
MKIVYIMGAGTSKEAGAPLMDEFFSEAEKIVDSINNSDNDFIDELNDKIPNDDDCDTLRDRFVNVLKFRHDNLPNSNIEELFSYIETMLSISKDKNDYFQNLKDDMIYLISKVLDITLAGRDFRIHKSFMETIGHKAPVTSIISLNYDILFDIYYTSYPRLDKMSEGEFLISGINYGCNYTKFDGEFQNKKEINTGARLSLLKLHGSLNWLQCKNCNKMFSTLDGKILHRLYEEPDYKFKCPTCGDSLLKPLLIPPSLTKLAIISDSSPMKKIWDSAFRELVGADKIVIIGYSFPEADIHFKLFLQGALHRNVRERKSPVKIKVITRNKFGEDKVKFEDNYKRVFGGLGEMLDIEFIYRDFSKYSPYEEESA